ncbi:Shedu anti-phage system protein SduA domain-containing protein [Prescottella equi]
MDTYDDGFDQGPTEADFVDHAGDLAEMREAVRELRETEARKAREAAAEPSLTEFLTSWDDITQEDVDEFRAVLLEATSEPPLAAFLRERPHLLVQSLSGGHGRWVIPEKKFGDHYKGDFMIAEKSSIGFEWLAVELEGPQRKMFNLNGDINYWLNHAIQQINDWRNYISDNGDTVRRPRDRHGLGLVDIDSDVRGLVIIGRRDETPSSTNSRRRRLAVNNNLDIHSWDWLVEQAQMRCDALEGKRQREARESG